MRQRYKKRVQTPEELFDELRTKFVPLRKNIFDKALGLAKRDLSNKIRIAIKNEGYVFLSLKKFLTEKCEIDTTDERTFLYVEGIAVVSWANFPILEAQNGKVTADYDLKNETDD